MDFLLRSVVFFVLIYSVVVLGIVLRGFTQAMAAALMGDRNPQIIERLSPNPLRHFNVSRSLLTAFYTNLFLSPLFAGRETPLNPKHWKNGKWGLLAVYLSGPLVLLLIGIGLSWFIFDQKILVGLHPVLTILIQASRMSFIALAVYHLLPFAPLDGYKVLTLLTNRETQIKWARLERESALYHGLGLLLFVAPMTLFISSILVRIFR